MNLEQLSERALEVRSKYAILEKQKHGREWSGGEIAQGFVGDIGDLMKLVMAKEGIRKIADVDTKLKHELSDCLWSLLVLAKHYDINLEASFLETMDELDARLKD
jgi:NTP pyrophosphatase (non-canonical NTP hydrolase)